MTIEDYCEMNHVIVRSCFDLPSRVGGTCFHDDEGTEIVLINALCCSEKQQSSLNHELRHIRRGEMYDSAYTEYQ